MKIMPDERPQSPQAFTEWSTDATCGVFSKHTQPWYETTQNNLYAKLQEHAFFSGLPTSLQALAIKYSDEHKASLAALGRDLEPEWKKKSYQSFLEKLYRLNCVENASFPGPPPGGWVSLDSSFERVDDIVRTTIVVAYADGPQFLGDSLSALAGQAGLECTTKDHAQEKGYYAYHLYPRVEVTVASTLGSTEYFERKVPVEIQVTTELQGALREITHKLYERERLVGALAKNWKSDFGSGRFRAAYMAHSLRFIEAMIVDLRNNLERAEATE
jgi:ppGpp synthetase/RelA/SpoT-type nucleotidyltranferase